MTLHKITVPTPFKVGDVNLYLLKGETISLIDAGPNTEMAWEALLTGLSDHRLNINDIDQIILTHHHVDHFGMAAKLIDASGRIKLYCHPQSAPFITLNEERFQEVIDYFYRFYQEQGVPEEMARMAENIRALYRDYSLPLTIDGWLEEGDTLPQEPNWKVYHFPGHAQDQLGFYHEKDKVLIASDHLIQQISSNAILEAPYGLGPRPKTLIQYRHSLERCLSMDISIAHSGHGNDIDQVSALIQTRLNKQVQRAEDLYQLFAGNPRTAFEIASVYYGQRIYREMPLIMSEIIGHLDLLESWGRLTARKEGDQVIYVPLHG